MDIKSCPCKGCTERTATCHGECLMYREYKASLSDNKAEIARQREAEYLYYENLRRLIRNNKGMKR